MSYELIVHLLSIKCMPVLDGLEACSNNASDVRSFKHPVNIAFMNIFNTRSASAVHECQLAFDFRIWREHTCKRKLKFLTVYKHNAIARGWRNTRS